MKTRTVLFSVLLVGICLSLTSCAPEGPTMEQYGFFSGLWHGICLFFAVIGKLFGMNIGIQALNNTGTTYWLGFLLGMLLIGGAGGGASRRI